ncbi:helix-turn-helix domain-containing protein [Paenibacillus sp. GD4]|uniref:helix-turn-helix domain-containing protein n=1 Tax=Paenibacillus sp. GD4 TaxID=3068890 RepID=UPI002796D847|nr:helix-turn-helix domain-containing protein [Paenibacillus sp. GD4]MDQ1910727.1 helix-turn-helix domain-containing protein [Paenibacillus sp. GD4]
MAKNHNDPAVESKSPPPGILVSGHFTEPFGYATNRSKGTRDWLITFTLAGEGEYRMGSDAYRCGEGDVVLLSPGTPHHYLTPEGETWEFVWAHFVPEPGWSELLRLPAKLPGHHGTHVKTKLLRNRLTDGFRRLIQDSRETTYWANLLAMNDMKEILILLQQNLDERNTLDSRVEDTIQYLSSHLKQQHSIEDLAKRVLLSPSRFAHLFKEQTGDSVIETLLKLRLRHAARLLEHTALQVGEIAEEVGFRSPFYMTKQFTALYGQSPTRYRAKHQQTQRHRRTHNAQDSTT